MTTSVSPARGAMRRGGAPARRRIRLLVLVSGGALAGAAVLYGAALAVTGSGVPRGAEVFGIDIGGLSVADAERLLAAEVVDVAPSTVRTTAAGRTFDVDTARAGLGVDVARTVAAARAGWAEPARAWGSLLGLDRDVTPVLAVDRPALAATVGGIAAEVDEQMVEGGIDFADGTARAITPAAGRAVDFPAAAEAIARAYRDDDTAAAVPLPVAVVHPTVGDAAVQAALAEFGERAVDGPLTLRVAGDSVELRPAELGRYLSTAARDGWLRLVVAGDRIAADLAERYPDLGTEPRDAAFRIADGRPEIVPGRAGRTLDPTDLGDAVAGALTGSDPDRVVVADVRETEPEFTTAQARALGIEEKLSSFRTEYPLAEYRVNNIGRAAALMDGSLIRPGETWSLNATVGKRTRGNGFVEGYIIRDGQFTEELGGGVSQSATTVFNAVFFAGLKDVEHHPHSLYISRYPAGREATVAFGAKDLRFTNDSGHGVLMQAQAGPGWIEVTLWGTKVWDEIRSISSERTDIRAPQEVESDAPDCEKQEPVDGFDISVTRVFVRDGAEAKRETFHTEYQPTDKITCVEDTTEERAEGDRDDRDGKRNEDDRDGRQKGRDRNSDADPVESPSPSPEPSESPSPVDVGRR